MTECTTPSDEETCPRIDEFALYFTPSSESLEAGASMRAPATGRQSELAKMPAFRRLPDTDQGSRASINAAPFGLPQPVTKS